MDQGNTGYIILCSALVLLMTPGLAFFYGGLVKAKSVVSMMMMSFGAIGLVAVVWAVYGFAIAFPDVAAPSYVGITGVLPAPGVAGAPGASIFGIQLGQIGLGDALTTIGAYPQMAFVFFQATFAIITVALVSGAIADRAKFGAWMLFAFLWVTFVYFPVANWVFNFTLCTPELVAAGSCLEGQTFASGGWLTYGLQNIFGLGAIDFAGGTAVHINAGAAALALSIVAGQRVGFAKGAFAPHNPPFVLLGAGLLWFGWFGFNAGSELAADPTAANAAVNTLIAPAAALLAWCVVERLRDGKATAVGAASGVVAGLVAITPACAALTPIWAIVLGVLAGALCALAGDLKFRWGFDDSLDVVSIHLVGGLVGTLYLGFFATGTGLLFSGSFTQLIVQAIAAASVLVYSFVLAFVLAWIVEKTIGIRVKREDELAGIDSVVHGETSYVFTGRD
jgi:Amt family ammonium transporter